MDPQTLLDSTFFLIPSFMPKKGLDPQVSRHFPSEAGGMVHSLTEMQTARQEQIHSTF